MKKRQIISFFLIFALLFGIVSALPLTAQAATASGTCGDNLTWSLDGGTLTISGTGAMTNYTYSLVAPWFHELITSVVIKSGAISIGNYAFESCTSLTSITIPNSVTSIGDHAFDGCESLISITIPKNVTNIGNHAFYDCINLTNVTIPNSVTSIGDWAFDGCESLTSITIPQSVTNIGIWAFANCTSLTNITIPASVTYIGWNAFSGCSSLTSMEVSSGNSVYHGAGNCIIETDSKTLIAGCKSSVIPTDGSVTSIGNYAFYRCNGLKSITIPKRVTCILKSAFSGCSNLTSMKVTSGNSVYHSAGNCIIETDSKTLIAGCKSSVIPTDGSVTSIGNYAFFCCTSLKSITIPNSVTSIGDCAFSSCTALTSITIPNSVTSIGECAFSGCASLIGIIIPDGITIIGFSTFYGCTSLTSITIPYGVTSIGSQAFLHCASLTSITIPDSVTSIDDRAFNSCSALTDVYYGGSEAEWNAISIDDYNECLTNATIHYNCIGMSTFCDYFVIGRDNNSFRNSYNDFTEYIRVRDNTVGSGYLTSVTYYNRLITGFTDEEIKDFDSYLFEKDWSGSCFGISLSMLWAITGEIDITDFYAGGYYDSNIGKYYDLKAPCVDLNLRDYINYCQCLQFTDQVTSYTINKCDSNANWAEYWEETYRTVASATSAEEPVLFAYEAPFGAHGVLICGCENGDNAYRFIIYDCNVGEFTYLNVSKNCYGDFSFVDSAGNSYTDITSENWIYFKYFDVSGADPSIAIDPNAKLLIEVRRVSDAYVEADSTAKFKAKATGNGLTYQWQYRTSSSGSWKNSGASTAKKATIKVTGKTNRDGYQYRCKITDSTGKVAYTNAATLHVLGITAQPTSQYVKADKKATFEVEATGDGLKYQWQYRKSSLGSWKNSEASTANEPTIEITGKTSRNGYQYRCVITDSAGNVVKSEAATLYVLGITTQPSNQSVKADKTAKFKVKATGDGLTYQWQYRTSSTGKWKNSTASTATSATLKTTGKTSRNGYQYRCKITDSAGNVVYSEPATLYVLGIKTQPTSQMVSAGTSVKFTVKATGDGLTYQWQYRTSSSGTWKNSGASTATKATIKINGTTSKNGYQYRCKITDSAGNVVYSDAATLTVN